MNPEPHRNWSVMECVLESLVNLKNGKISINPLTAGAVHIYFLHFLLAHYISAFKPVKDKK